MKRLLCLVLSATLLNACAASPEAPETPEADIRVSGNRIFLPVSVNGVETEAILDSGAEMTALDAAFGREAGLTAFGNELVRGTGSGTQEVQFAEGVSLQAAGQTLEDQTVVILDLTDVSTRLVGEPLTVVMGRELFDAGRFHLDIDRGIFEGVPADTVPPGVRLPLTEAKGIMQVPISINDGTPIPADFDLGNGSEVLLGWDYAEAAGLLAEDNVIGTRQGGGIGGPVELTLVRVESLRLGDFVVRDLVASVSPLPDAADANIGVSVLREFDLVIDFPAESVWVSRKQ